jgi:4-azaleucine resistance transporter AzlC
LTHSKEDSFLRGMMEMMPLSISAAPFGLMVGAMAANAGLGHVDILMMSGLVYAGASQFTALGMWDQPVPVLAIIGVTLMVNLRMILMGAALAPHVRHLPLYCRWPFVLVFADETWAIALRRSAERPLAVPYVFGLVIPFYVNWLFWSVLGVTFGYLVTEPEKYGFDFVFITIFISLVMGFCKTRRDVPPLLVSASVAFLTHRYVPGVWYIFAGGLAGVITGAVFYKGKSR